MKLNVANVVYWRKKDGCELLVICGLNITTGMAIIDDDTYNYFSERLHEEHLEYAPNGDTSYTEEAQEYFNDRYDFYLDKISKSIINN